MPGARHLEHHGSEPVPHEVVDVTRDPTPLGEQRLPGQLAPRGVELGRELRVVREGSADHPGEDDAHDPVGDGDLGRVWTKITATGEATVSTPSTMAVLRDGDQRPTTKASTDSSNMSGSSSPERCAATTGR